MISGTVEFPYHMFDDKADVTQENAYVQNI
jgi:hypothetical protein